MRAVVQRVASAAVDVGGARLSEIGRGLLVLLGVGKEDADQDLAWMAEKIAHLRIFEDDEGKMNRSVLDTTRQVLVVSQFTLYGDTRKGRRPSFIEAREPNEANALYEALCERLRALGLTVGTGRFRAQMQVALVNDGPVTLWLDSRAS
jgi:D-aminoacyl-tRNA deacylase